MIIGEQVKLYTWFLKTRCKGGLKKYTDWSNAKRYHNSVAKVYKIDDDHNQSDISSIYKDAAKHHRPVIWVVWNDGDESWYFDEEIESIPVVPA